MSNFEKGRWNEKLGEREKGRSEERLFAAVLPMGRRERDGRRRNTGVAKALSLKAIKLERERG